LPRLKNTDLLFSAIADGAASLLWEKDTFAYAPFYAEDVKRYAGLIGGRPPAGVDLTGYVVRPEVARAQMNADSAVIARSGTEAAADASGAPTRSASGIDSNVV